MFMDILIPIPVLHVYIYSFHMPLFFIISGFCMKHLLCKKELDMKYEIKKRAKRLMVPYLFYSYCAIIPKLIFNVFMYNPFEIRELWEIWLGKSPSSTLWYIWNLFVINVLFLIISRITSKKIVWFLISAIMYAGYLIMPNCYFNNLLKYPLFFVIGIFLADYFDQISLRVKNKWHLPIILLLINFFVVLAAPENRFVNLLTSMLGSTAMLCLAINIGSGNSRLKHYLEIASEYSYGIYLMSPYVIVAIRVFLYKQLGFPYMLSMILMLSLGYFIPYVFIKYVVRKNKLMSRILLGQESP